MPLQVVVGLVTQGVASLDLLDPIHPYDRMENSLLCLPEHRHQEQKTRGRSPKAGCIVIISFPLHPFYAQCLLLSMQMRGHHP